MLALLGSSGVMGILFQIFFQVPLIIFIRKSIWYLVKSLPCTCASFVAFGVCVGSRTSLIWYSSHTRVSSAVSVRKSSWLSV